MSLRPLTGKPGYDWEYLKMPDYVDAIFEPSGTGVYELILRVLLSA